MSSSLEIVCDACGEETLLRREPVYDGFTKVGEALSCMACGKAFADEADIPYKIARKIEIFTEADRSQAEDVFDNDADTRNCRHCESYLKNPFTQWCTRHRKDVDAMDTCEAFKRKKEDDETTGGVEALF